MRTLILTAALAALCTLPALAQQDSLPRRSSIGAAVDNDSEGGAQVAAVVPGTPAERAHMQQGDIIHHFGGATISTAADFVTAVHAARAGQPIPVDITRGGAPQTLSVTLIEAPRENDPDVRTTYGAVRVDGVLRRTLVTAPRNAHGRLPAMLLIGGIGCYSIDNPTDATNPYTILTHDLARRGIVAMRVEKSGVGDSQGAPCNSVDFNTELHGYEAGLEALRRSPGVNPNQIFLFGHSIGSVGAPRIAATHPVAGVVVAQVLGRNWVEYELINTRRQLELHGYPPQQVDAIMLEKASCMNRLLLQHEPAADINRTTPDCQGLNLMPASQAYMQDLAAMNVADPWTHVDAPVLVIYGTSDFVTDQADHQRLVDIVNGAHPNRASLQLIPGVDHAFTQADTQQTAYANSEQGRHTPYDSRVSSAVADWICAHSHC